MNKKTRREYFTTNAFNNGENNMTENKKQYVKIASDVHYYYKLKALTSKMTLEDAIDLILREGMKDETITLQ